MRTHFLWPNGVYNREVPLYIGIIQNTHVNYGLVLVHKCMYMYTYVHV